MKSFLTKNTFALLILLVAAILRLANLGNVDFVHDELSALSRTGFLNFFELIQKGVLTDTHPPLVQVFLNYWVLLTGYHEFTVKLPFILAGLGGIWLVWLIGKAWFSETAALSAMAYLACSEFVIDYHQQARPYALGFFLCLLAVWAFIKYFQKEEPAQLKYLVLYIVATAAAALTHHLAMMFMALFSAGSLLIIQKTQFKQWIVAQLCILLLYLPNINILLNQFKQKGVGDWLGAPDWHSFYYIAAWFTHYSSLCALAIILPAMVGLALGWNKIETAKRKILLIILSLCCILIPFFYSIYVNPIFQFSSLFFILPFVLLLIFSGLPQTKTAWIIPLLILLATGGSFLLKRNYYKIAAHQPVAEICRQSISFLKDHPSQTTLVCLNVESWFVRFYQQKYQFSFPFETWYEKDFKGADFMQLIKERHPKNILLGWMPQLSIPLSRTENPCMLVHHKSPQLDFYAFGRMPDENCVEEKVLFQSQLFSATPDNYWEKYSQRTVRTDSLHYHTFSTQEEFGSAFEAPLEALPVNRHSILECSATFLDSLTGNVILTAVISRDGREYPLLYVAEESARQIVPGSNTKHLYLRTRMVDAFRENQQMRGCKLKVYIWNREKIPLRVSQIQVKWVEGNPEMYGLYED